MKVHIGAHARRWTTSRFEQWWLEKQHGKFHWNIEDTELTTADHFVTNICDKWQTVLNLLINKPYFDRKKRKVNIQLDPYDTWNMDNTLSLIILPLLKQLQKDKQGGPFVDDEDVPIALQSVSAPVKEDDCDTDGNWFKRWDWVMDEMIWTFEQLTDDNNDDQFHTGNMDIEFKKIGDSKFNEMVNGAKHTHVFDVEGHKKHHERISKGLLLFGKYYQGLWD